MNDRSIRQEDADKERLRQNKSKSQAELKQAQDFEAALARTANATRSPEAERAYQQQVRDARAKTLQATLGVLQAEGAEQERLRTLALKAIEDVVAARTRSVDLQLSQIATVKGARDRATKDAEAGSARETAAIDIATKALERQNALLTARVNLQNAKLGAQSSAEEIELTKVNRAIEIRKQLDGESTISAEERIVLMRELADLAGSSARSEYALVKDKIEIEKRQILTKRESVLFEQAAARASLSLEQRKIDLSNQRAVIEARIAEFKAKQAVLEAQSLARQTELTNQKSIEAAQLALQQAQAQQPGRERDRAIAEAQNKVTIVKADATESTANAAQGIDLAKQQVTLAAQNTESTLQQVKYQSEINKAQTEALDIQQKTVIKQLAAAEAAKGYASELERVKAAYSTPPSEISKPLIFGQGGRKGGYVGDNNPLPSIDASRSQVLKNLGSLGDLNLNVGGSKSNGDRETIEAIKSLEQTISTRDPKVVTNVAFAAPDTSQYDSYNKLQRSIARSSV